MYQPLSTRLARAVLLCGALDFQSAIAATVARYDFDDAGGKFANVAEDVAPHLVASPWTVVNGTLTSGTGVTGSALSARSFESQNRLSFFLTPDAGHMLTLDHISFALRVINTGPKLWRVTLNNVDIATGTTHTTFTDELVTLHAVTSTQGFELALFGNKASSSAGVLRLDNVVVDGTLSAVPIPASGYLLASALVGGVRRTIRRRK